MKIWKYPIQVTDYQVVMMPHGAVILCAQFQSGVLCLWAMVNPANEEIMRQFEVIGTGNQIEQTSRKYIGTVQQAGGMLVWHIFERL